MPDEPTPTGKPPDNLFNKEKDDSSFVTEELAAMKPNIHRWLAAWNILAGILAFALAVFIWSNNIEPLEENKTITTMQQNHTVADSLSQNDVDSTQVVSTQNDTNKSESLDKGIVLLLISFLFGVLGGSTHGLASLMDFRGQRRLFKSWSLWYFGRPILGGMVSVIFYVTIKAGFFSGSTDVVDNATSLYGIASISTLVGMFTDAATNKLGELFSTLFSTTGKKREGKLTTDKPEE